MDVTWEIIKTFATSKGLTLQYVDIGNRYWIKLFDGNFELVTNILKTSPASDDQADFENNYKTGSNTRISPVSVSGAITTDNIGNQKIVGSVASLAADTGNPVKTGAKFNTTLPAPTNGQRVDTQANQFGETSIQFRNKSHRIQGTGTNVIKSGSGRLHGISINNPMGGGVLTIYNNTAGSGTIIMKISLASGTGPLPPTFIGPLGAEFDTGLTIVVTSGSTNDFTLFYQ